METTDDRGREALRHHAAELLGEARETRPEPTITDLPRADYAALTYAAMGYAMLFELAVRRFEPPLRALAPKHLRACAEAAPSSRRRR